MTLNQFILHYAIHPADAIILNKKLFGMVDHYAIYLGVYDNEHKFVANYTKGVRVLENYELNGFLSTMIANRIEKCPGSFANRNAAIERAISKIGNNSYNLLTNNCEHFKTWVHTGTHESKQVNEAVQGAILGVGIAAALVGVWALFSEEKS